MLFALVSDLHLLWSNPQSRKDNLPTTQLSKLEYILSWAKDNQATILQGGDFFDTPRSWKLLPIIIDLLNKYRVPIYTIFGQHDTYMYSESTRDATSLGILAKSGLVKILSDHCEVPLETLFGNTKPINLYGCNFGQQIPKVQNKKYLNILVIHKNIYDSKTYPGQGGQDAKTFLRRNKNFNLILCADIHRKFKSKIINKRTGTNRYIVNTGPILRKSANEYNRSHMPGFYSFESDSSKLIWNEIPHRKSTKVLEFNTTAKIESGKFTKLVEEIQSRTTNSKTDFKENLSKVLSSRQIRPGSKRLLSEVMDNG